MNTQNFGSENGRIEKVAQGFFKSRFFITALMLHFIVVLIFGGTVLIAPRLMPTPDFEGTYVEAEGVPLPERPRERPAQITGAPGPDQTTLTPRVDLIRTLQPSPGEVQSFVPSAVPPHTGERSVVAEPFIVCGGPLEPHNIAPAVLVEIKRSVDEWIQRPRGSSRVTDAEVTFTAYVAKYGKGNDWASTNWLRNGKIEGGSLANLLYFMNKMSKGKIKAEPQALPLDLSSDEILAKRPPFIFFTGHKDFVLTDKEIENLRKYILIGGCIWGDSSLPGRRSRFDIAFRREMRRVISDTDKQWEEIGKNHPMYTRNLYYQDIVTPPKGMNYYQEPVYALKFGGEVAVIYTANDYGDMWQIGLDEKGAVDFSRNEKRQLIALNHELWSMRGNYFRNLDEPSVLQAYKFGTNVVFHLLTRWEERVASVPRSL